MDKTGINEKEFKVKLDRDWFPNPIIIIQNENKMKQIKLKWLVGLFGFVSILFGIIPGIIGILTYLISDKHSFYLGWHISIEVIGWMLLGILSIFIGISIVALLKIFWDMIFE